MKNHKLFISVLTVIYWIKQSLPTEPMMLTQTLLIRGLCERRRQSRMASNCTWSKANVISDLNTAQASLDSLK